MADNQSTPAPRIRQEFPEVAGKIVEIVELSVDPDYYAITIRFHDKTVLSFSIEPCVFTFPRYSQWTPEGEENIVTQYEPIRSRLLKT